MGYQTEQNIHIGVPEREERGNGTEITFEEWLQHPRFEETCESTNPKVQ